MGRPLIAEQTLIKLRALDERAMPSTCKIMGFDCEEQFGQTVCSDEMTELSEVPCRVLVGGMQPQEAVTGGRMSDEADGEVSLPVGTIVSSEHEIHATTNGVTSKFDVLGDPFLSSYDTNLRVRVKLEG